MKKLFSKVTALLLCAGLLLSCVVPVGAMMALPLKVGDVDRDNNITSVDAALILRFLAHMHKPSELQIALSDVDGDDIMTVLDATAIQRHLADLPGPFTNAEIADYFCGFTSFHSDAEISVADHYSTADICYVSVPVTFFPKVYGEPRRYTLSVDGETVSTIEARDYDRADGVTYTFFEEGEHTVACDAECCYGQHVQSSRRVQVEKLPEDGRPAVMGAAFYDQSRTSSGNGILTVTAAGGTAPYRYSYKLYYDRLNPLCLSSEDESESMPITINDYSTGYIEKNEINVIELFAEYVKPPTDLGQSDVMRVELTVLDAQARESQPVTVSFIGYDVCY